MKGLKQTAHQICFSVHPSISPAPLSNCALSTHCIHKFLEKKNRDFSEKQIKLSLNSSNDTKRMSNWPSRKKRFTLQRLRQMLKPRDITVRLLRLCFMSFINQDSTFELLKEKFRTRRGHVPLFCCWVLGLPMSQTVDWSFYLKTGWPCYQHSYW